jgi:hypothetical protein
MTHPQGWSDPPNKYNGALPADMVGFPRDTCAYNDPVTGNPGTCDINNGGVHWGDGTWPAADYMLSNHPGTPIGNVPDLDGDGTRSRWEVYQWEMDPLNLSSNAMETSDPTCSTAYTPTQIDRRRVTVAVIDDCSTLVGTTQTKPDSYADVFMPEPMGAFDGNADLYLEVIGPAANGPENGTRWVVRLVR